MLRTLKRLLGVGMVPAEQLTLDFTPVARPATPVARPTVHRTPGSAARRARQAAAAHLLDRLRGHGLQRIERCRVTRNRNVMVSFSGGELRVHEGYRDAPDHVLRAIVVFVEGRTRAERREAQRTIVAFPIASSVPAPRRHRTLPEDRAIAEQLARWHAQYNARHFGAALSIVTIRVSRRMRSRLGHYTAAARGEPAEIAISWRHVRRHGWEEALHTLLHEMVHQWQDEAGHAIDHGAQFRAKAREVGVAPFARRVITAGAMRAERPALHGRRAAREG